MLTHAHFDHLGFAERARTELGVPVFVHENDEPLTRLPRQYAHERSRIRYFLTQFRAFPMVAALVRARAFWPAPVREVTRYVGGVLPVPGSPHVVFTPGHTLGHCALHFPDRDTGDRRRRSGDARPLHGRDRPADRGRSGHRGLGAPAPRGKAARRDAHGE